jgi:release factor glutamine methyltransferase
MDDRLGYARTPPSRFRRYLRSTIHFLAYHFLLRRPWSTVSRAAGFRLKVRPTVFHPGWFPSSKFFARYISQLDLTGKRVADVGTGSGILALAAARAGAANIVAVDINPNAARTAAENAHANGLGGRVMALCSNALSALAPRPIFDVILMAPPIHAGEPLDLADRALQAGPQYRDIALFFEQARERLAPDGCAYILMSSDSDRAALHTLIDRAGFRARLAAEHPILIETLFVYELRASKLR